MIAPSTRALDNFISSARLDDYCHRLASTEGYLVGPRDFDRWIAWVHEPGPPPRRRRAPCETTSKPTSITTSVVAPKEARSVRTPSSDRSAPIDPRLAAILREERDSLRKKQQPTARPKTERRGQKLSDADAAAIRRRVANGETQKNVARDFGVSQSLVCFIANGARHSPACSP